MCKVGVIGALAVPFIFLSCVCLNPALCIVGRDLVLTPRQGLQLTGKSIYYRDDSNEVLQNLTIHPWERTLKHVTFVTLFTDAAASAVAGNISKLKEYADFLSSPYIKKENENPIRFGDIVMLANGRLERMDNRSFRFVEGNCGYDCAPERVWALWQVQKIRHRDQRNNFRYEMKFSVSPLRKESNDVATNSPNDSEEINQGDMYVRQNALKTYIQKEDDYPLSFGRIIYPEETAFAQRRLDNENTPRNFRQIKRPVNMDYRQVTPIPQPTFLHNVYQAPPHGLPPPPERLNIGEYIKALGHPPATPKIELFPNVYNNMMTRSNFLQPTTFRPNYQVRLPRPDIYPPLQDFIKFPEDRREIGLDENKLKTPLVTHHFHHHFFMPGSGESVGEGNSLENQIASGEPQNDINRQVTPNFRDDRFEVATTPKAPQDLLPAPQKISFPIRQFGEHIVEVTPPSPLRKPHAYSMYSQRHATAKMPLYIHPMPTEEQRTTVKPFVGSEQITDSFRYSEPDPLYTSNGELDPAYQTSSQNTQSNLLEAQLPTPEENQDLSVPSESSSEDKSDLELNHSEKDVQISTQKTTDTTIYTEPPQATTSRLSTTTTTTTAAPTTITTNSPSTHEPRYLTTSIPTTPETATIKPFTPTNHFVSTSTTESALRSISRTRITRVTTTSTEPPAVKWKSKRRNQHSQIKYNSKQVKNEEDNNAKSSTRHEEVLPPSEASHTSSKNFNYTDSTMTATPSPPIQRDEDIFEVLTQKSVSKSVSIKVGNNGQEIPIIIDDDVVNNEVRKE